MKPIDDTIPVAYARRFSEMFVPKYLKGRREHKTILTSRNLLPHAEEEVLDLWAYLQGLRHQRDVMEWLLIKALETHNIHPTESVSYIERAINILTIGNEQGWPEGVTHPEEVEKETNSGENS